MTGDLPPLPTVTPRQLIDLAGGFLLLLAAYYAVRVRYSDNAAYCEAYRRAALQTVTGYLVFSYASFVLWPDSAAWPVQTGYHLYAFFEQLETVPAKADAHLTDYYIVLLQQIGYATGTGTGPGVASTAMPGVIGTVEGTVRTVGLVVYTLVFTVVSLSLQVPGRIVGGVQDALD